MSNMSFPIVGDVVNTQLSPPLMSRSSPSIGPVNSSTPSPVFTSAPLIRSSPKSHTESPAEHDNSTESPWPAAERGTRTESPWSAAERGQIIAVIEPEWRAKTRNIPNFVMFYTHFAEIFKGAQMQAYLLNQSLDRIVLLVDLASEKIDDRLDTVCGKLDTEVAGYIHIICISRDEKINIPQIDKYRGKDVSVSLMHYDGGRYTNIPTVCRAIVNAFKYDEVSSDSD